MQFTDEQVKALAYALRLANNQTGPNERTGVQKAAERISDLIAEDNVAYDRDKFLDSVYTTTVTRPADFEPSTSLDQDFDPTQAVPLEVDETLSELYKTGAEDHLDAQKDYYAGRW